MNRIKLLIISLVTFLICTTSVYAECTTENLSRLNNLARNVKASYELKTMQKKIEDGFPDGLTAEEEQNYYVTVEYYTIYITNLTEDLYVIVNDGATNKTYYYSDTDNGTLSFDQMDTKELHTYNITVYSSSHAGDCQDQKLYSLPKLVTPYFNIYSTESKCNGYEDFYLCYKYLSIENYPSYNEFTKLLEQYIESKGETERPVEPKPEEDPNPLVEHKGTIVIISLLVIVVGGVAAYYIIINQKRSDKHE